MANDERCARCGHARHDHRNGRAIRGVGGVDGEMCWACYDDECSRGAWKGTYIHAFALAPAPTPSPDTPMIEDCSHSFVHLLGGYRCTRCGTQMVHTADTCDECRHMTSPDTQREEDALDAAEALWGVVANVSEGDWSQQSSEWCRAAERARDLYHAALRKRGGR